jgi:hypothetical protein
MFYAPYLAPLFLTQLSCHLQKMKIPRFWPRLTLRPLFPQSPSIPRDCEKIGLTLFHVIPAPYQVRGKLQPGDRREAE